MEGLVDVFPVDKVIPDLVEALGRATRAVLSAPPGAGKTTRVPRALLRAPWLNKKRIVMLEPRRLAARRAAAYMAQQMGERVGRTVGYRIRGDAAVSSQTRIEVVTEGILTRMLHSAPDLPDVGLVIFDEFHERSIHADLGLAFALDVQEHLRPDLHILVMSATLDGVGVAELLRGAPIIESSGRLFPIETNHSRFSSDKPLETRIANTVSRALKASDGDILVFLPGMREIRRAEEQLMALSPDDVIVHVLHGDLAPAVQEAALSPAPSGKRKVILSTSIAETSLTIDGVRIVVDAGLARMAQFDPRRGMSGLITVPVSKAVADQRRGRAGRQAPGVCYRLWTEKEHEELSEYPIPEIRSSDLAHTALDLARWGTPNGDGLAFLDAPPKAHLLQAQNTLRNLGAMKEDGRLTAHGQEMAMLPIHPRLAHMIIKGKRLGMGSTACAVAALLEEREFVTGGKKSDADISPYVEDFLAGRGAAGTLRERVSAQVQRLRDSLGVKKADSEKADVGILVALAYPERIARRRPERHGLYQLASGTTALLPQGSTLHREEFLAVADVEAATGANKIFLAAPLNPNLLEKTFSAEIVNERSIEWNSGESRVVVRGVRRLGAVVLAEQKVEPEGDEIARALLKGVRHNGLNCLPWNKDAARFRERVEWAKRELMELSELPALSDEALISSLEEWLMPFVGGMIKLEQLKRLDLTEILQSRLGHQQLRQLDRLAPSHIVVPSGSKIALEYGAAANPALSVKLQELFGLVDTPTVGGGKIPITIHLLSPAARPLAVTQDLRSFWQTVYPEFRKQMRARYPKHPWPEDPLTAAPTRKTVKRK
jgi:ATP-dependent helicase HrpB